MDSPKGLVALVQGDIVEIHCWNSTGAAVEPKPLGALRLVACTASSRPTNVSCRPRARAAPRHSMARREIADLSLLTYKLTRSCESNRGLVPGFGSRAW